MPARNTLEIIIQGKDEASKAIGDVEGSLSKLGSAAATAVKVAATAAVAIGGALLEMSREAAPIEGIKKAFDGLNQSIGQSSDSMLASLQKSSLGMISNKDLMMNFNMAAQLVNKTFATQLPDAMQYLTKVSAATGQSMDYLMNSLILGVGRLSPRILDNLAIQVSLNDAYEAYAKSVHKSADSLTREEQQIALTNAVMEKLKENTAAMPDIAGNASTKIEAFNASMTNLKNDIGMAFLPVLKLLLDGFSGLVHDIGPGVVDIVGKMADAITLFFTGAGGDALGGANSPIVQTILSLRNTIEGIIAYVQNAVAAGQDPISAFLDAMSNATGRAAPIFQLLHDAWTQYVQPVLDTISNVATKSIGPALDSLGKGFSGFFDSLRGADPTILTLVKNFMISFAGIGTLLAGAVMTGIGNALPKVGEGIRNVVDAFSALAKGDMDTASEKAKAAIGNLAEAILRFAAAPADVIINMVESLTGLDLASANQVVDALIAVFQRLPDVLPGLIHDAGVAMQYEWDKMILDILMKMGDTIGKIPILKNSALVDNINQGIAGVTKEMQAMEVGKDLGEALRAEVAKGVGGADIGKAISFSLGREGAWNPDVMKTVSSDFVENFRKSMQIAMAQGDWKSVFSMDKWAFDVGGFDVKLDPSKFAKSLGDSLMKIKNDVEAQQQLEMAVPLALHAGVDPMKLFTDIMKYITDTGTKVEASRFINIAAPVALKVGGQEMQNSVIRQLYDVIETAGKDPNYKAEPRVDVKVNSLPDPIFAQFNKLIGAAAGLQNIPATATADVTVNAGTIDVAAIAAAVKSAIDGVISGAQSIIDKAAAAIKSTASSAAASATSTASSAPKASSTKAAPTADYPHVVSAGQTVMINPSAGPELFTPTEKGYMQPNAGGLGSLTVNFLGTGGPRNATEADDIGFHLVNALRMRGMAVQG